MHWGYAQYCAYYDHYAYDYAYYAFYLHNDSACLMNCWTYYAHYYSNYYHYATCCACYAYIMQNKIITLISWPIIIIIQIIRHIYNHFDYKIRCLFFAYCYALLLIISLCMLLLWLEYAKSFTTQYT